MTTIARTAARLGLGSNTRPVDRRSSTGRATGAIVGTRPVTASNAIGLHHDPLMQTLR